MADIHLTPERNAVQGFKKAIKTVNNLAPDFVITGGDLIMDAIEQPYERADSLYTLYSEISVNPLDPVAPYRWNEQLQDKGYQQLSFNLSIPLFNRLDIQRGISTAKVSYLDARVVLDQTRQTLYQMIQQAYADANAALEDYEAFQEAAKAMEEAFYYAEQRYNVGILNSVDYNTAKNNLTRAQSDLLQAKYQYIFYAQILDFYAGNPITL